MSWTDKLTTQAQIDALKTDIATLEDSIASAADADIQTYRLSSGRQVGRIPIAEKIQLHDFYTKKLLDLENKKSIDDGDGNTRLFKPRF